VPAHSAKEALLNNIHFAIFCMQAQQIKQEPMDQQSSMGPEPAVAPSPIEVPRITRGKRVNYSDSKVAVIDSTFKKTLISDKAFVEGIEDEEPARKVCGNHVSCLLFSVHVFQRIPCK
jgi:hypothetical protein